MSRSSKLALSILGCFTCLLALAATLGLTYIRTVHSPRLLTWSPYGFSELLIDYDGGFVRRGLIGALIQHYSHGQSALQVANLLIFTNLCVLAAALTLLVALSLRSNKILMATLWIMMPGGLFASAISNNFYYRKETFFFSGLATLGVMISVVRKLKPSRLRQFFAGGVGLLVFVSSVVFSLIHEGFIFLAAPANLLLLFAAVRLACSGDSPSVIFRWQKRAFISYCGVMALLFLASFAFHGGPTDAHAIWTHLNTADRTRIDPAGATEGALQSMNNSLLVSLSLPAHILVYGWGWFWLVPLLGLALYSLAIVALGGGDQSVRSPQNFARWVRIYLAIFAGALPIFLLGWDWGRWIASINLSFLIVSVSVLPDEIPAWFLNAPGQWLMRHVPRRPLVEPFAGSYFRLLSQRPVSIAMLLLLFALTCRLPEDVIQPTDSEYIVQVVGRRLQQVWHVHSHQQSASH